MRKLAEYDTGDLIITVKRAFMDFYVPGPNLFYLEEASNSNICD